MSSANSFGRHFKITTFGESHGVGLGVVIEGVPAGVLFSEKQVQSFLDRRRPGVWDSLQVVSSRQEPDQVEVLSGVFEEKTLGTPIAMLVRNVNAKSDDYQQIKSAPRSGHADDMWNGKFGHSDHRGGGRSSGRETVSRVMAGAVARMLSKQIKEEIEVTAWVQKLGSFELDQNEELQVGTKNSTKDIDQCVARFPASPEKQKAVKENLEQAKAQGESWGGVIKVSLRGLPSFLGQPVFHKFKNDLASAVLSVGACHSFSLGEFSENDRQSGIHFHNQGAEVYGGIRGGLTTGETVQFEVGFKPTSSILDVAKKGRHDPCILIRAVPVIEAMSWLVIADHLLWRRTDTLKESL